MKKILTVLFCFVCPFLAVADSSASSFFTPPTSDYSMIFLGNIFGLVDGVLSGSSQMLGHIFAIFNAAVLALGGVVVTYTLLVGTMNTSHDGQFLGQKWSSIWIPLRATIGLALMIPKASGYCLAQIIMMFLIVQGVGAADQVWNGALDYLNQGGVFVSATKPLSSSPTENSTATAEAVQQISSGASAILQGQVCMVGLQTLLENARTNYMKQKDNHSGPCFSAGMGTSMYTASWKPICEDSVPDFISTVNAVDVAAQLDPQSSATSLSVPMPNFTDSDWRFLNGVCGVLKWNKLDTASQTQNLTYLTADDIDTLNATRPIAVQQIYADLISVSKMMVMNDPMIVRPPDGGPAPYSSDAVYQFGVSYMATDQSYCTAPNSNCQLWSGIKNEKVDNYIFSGIEFNTAVNDYNSLMLPVLNLINENNSSSTSNAHHDFINDAKSYGWIMAGAYFYDLVYLEGTAAAGQGMVDGTSGLEGSTPYSPELLKSAFPPKDSQTCPPAAYNNYFNLCEWLNADSSVYTNLNHLITGHDYYEDLKVNLYVSHGNPAYYPVNPTTVTPEQARASASAYGYINNACLIVLPGQPGLATPTFAPIINIKPEEAIFTAPEINFPCGPTYFYYCIGRSIAEFFYDYILKNFINTLLKMVMTLFNDLVNRLLNIPLQTIMNLLNENVQLLNTSQVHPIIGIAAMGNSFINMAFNMYFALMAMSTLFTFVGLTILALMLPFISAWLGILFTIGFTDAYYVPMIPYMMFTFGSIAWFFAVMEAMVAGPIVSLGIAHPEGHDAFGKASDGIGILCNVMLRPVFMVIGYIGGIVISYVAIYTLNAGYTHFMGFWGQQSTTPSCTGDGEVLEPDGTCTKTSADVNCDSSGNCTHPTDDLVLSNYAAQFAGFFCLLVYTTIYVTVVEKCFSLIHIIPDKTLRWIGGQQESYGQDTVQWSEETKAQIKAGQEGTTKALNQTREGIDETMASGAQWAKKKLSSGGVEGKK